jgi:hypothetical protein
MMLMLPALLGSPHIALHPLRKTVAVVEWDGTRQPTGCCETIDEAEAVT